MTTPPKFAERVVGLLIPVACREEVLGDLHERCTSTIQYLKDAALNVPMVIASRIRRTADPQVLLMAFTLAYLAYLGAEWFHVSNHIDVLRPALPSLMILLGIILDDAYARPGTRSPLQLSRGPALGLMLAYLLQLGLPTGALSMRVWLYGSAVWLMLAPALRNLFPPIANQAVPASGPNENTPVVTQVVEVVGLVLVFGVIGFFIGLAWLTRLVVVLVVLMIFYKAQRD